MDSALHEPTHDEAQTMILSFGIPKFGSGSRKPAILALFALFAGAPPLVTGLVRRNGHPLFLG
jgi:hypothetical protein